MVSGFANSTLVITLAIGLLGGLFASPAEAVVKTYYVQHSNCSSNTSAVAWEQALTGSSNCGATRYVARNRSSGDAIVAYTPVFAVDTTITGQASGSNINFKDQDDGSYTGRVRLVEINAAGTDTLSTFGEVTVSGSRNSWRYITDLSSLSGTVRAGNRLGIVVGMTAGSANVRTMYARNGGGSQAENWFAVDEVSANSPPTLTVNEPNGVSDTVTQGANYSINYDLADSDNTVTAAFYYDTNNSGLDGTAISGACASAAEGTGVTCSWNTAGVTPGTYYVYGITNDGTNPAVNDYSPGMITISANANSQATLQVTQPAAGNVTIAEGSNFTVNYNLSDSDDVTTVAFFYNTNNSGADGTAIGGCAARPEATGGTCVWNTSGVAPGSYYVYGTTSGDGAGAATVYSAGTMTINDAPALSISAPNGITVTVGSVYNITYALTDSDNTITAAFYYDSDAVNFDGTLISGCGAAAEGGTCAWDTTGMTPGSYYVYGISTTDPYNSAAQAYSLGTITISSNSVASLTVSQPDNTNPTIAAGGNFTVNYILSDTDDTTTVAFFYSINNSGADGTAISGCGTKGETPGGTCVWNTTGVAPGSYYVYGTTSGDGAGATTVYSAGRLTIVGALTYVSGDDGTNPGAGDNIAGISRVGGGDDSNNLVGSNPKIDVEYTFSIKFTDDSGETPVAPRLYIAHRDPPTEGASGDFFVYQLVCTGATWVGGKTCTTTMKLGPAASHKFYFYAQKTNGTPVRIPLSGYSDGPLIQLINGFSLAGASRDINGSSLDGRAAFNSSSSYAWISAGLDTSWGFTFNGSYALVTNLNPAKAGKGYFVYKSSNTLPQLVSNADVTAATHTITLQPGWNLISNPYNGNVKLSAVQIRRNGATTNLWPAAATAGWIEPAIYYYQGSNWGETYASEFAPGAELVPWMGYWMYVKDGVNSYELIISKPTQ